MKHWLAAFGLCAALMLAPPAVAEESPESEDPGELARDGSFPNLVVGEALFELAHALVQRGSGDETKGRGGIPEYPLDEAPPVDVLLPKRERDEDLPDTFTWPSDALYTEARDLYEPLSDPRASGRILGDLAAIDHDAGSLGEAERDYASALALLQQAGDGRLEGILRMNLALLEQERGLHRLMVVVTVQAGPEGHRSVHELVLGRLVALRADLVDRGVERGHRLDRADRGLVRRGQRRGTARDAREPIRHGLDAAPAEARPGGPRVVRPVDELPLGAPDQALRLGSSGRGPLALWPRSPLDDAAAQLRRGFDRDFERLAIWDAERAHLATQVLPTPPQDQVFRAEGAPHRGHAARIGRHHRPCARCAAFPQLGMIDDGLRMTSGPADAQFGCSLQQTDS